MTKSYVSLKFDEFKEKFNKFFVQKKKLKGLENFAQVQNFSGTKYIPMIKSLMEDGFLDEKEEEFLEYQIKKVEIDVLTWSHKTKWVRQEMHRMSSRRKRIDPQLYFPFESLRSVPQMQYPIALVASETTRQVARV